ncbi:hypothetical protein EDB19DRAFT_1673610 [Suillus lakei]|nr:hypothetical protein EDB19DRAFT_1673610 [Suillus lakei]
MIHSRSTVLLYTALKSLMTCIGCSWVRDDVSQVHLGSETCPYFCDIWLTCIAPRKCSILALSKTLHTHTVRPNT